MLAESEADQRAANVGSVRMSERYAAFTFCDRIVDHVPAKSARALFLIPNGVEFPPSLVAEATGRLLPISTATPLVFRFTAFDGKGRGGPSAGQAGRACPDMAAPDARMTTLTAPSMRRHDAALTARSHEPRPG